MMKRIVARIRRVARGMVEIVPAQAETVRVPTPRPKRENQMVESLEQAKASPNGCAVGFCVVEFIS